MACSARLLLLTAAIASAVPLSAPATAVTIGDATTTVADATTVTIGDARTTVADATAVTIGDAGTTVADTTTTATDDAATLVYEPITAVTAGDIAATTEVPTTEEPLPQQPVVFVPVENRPSDEATLISQAPSQTTDDPRTEPLVLSTNEAPTEYPYIKKNISPSQMDEQDNIPSDEDFDEQNLFSELSMKERYIVSALKLRRQRCPGFVSGRTVGGVCLDKGECLLKRGVKVGSCALLGTCCYFQYSCGDVSHYKVSHFATPTSFQSECELRVNVFSRDVCQIRVDFEEFSLAQPERDDGYESDEVLSGFHCVRDRFTVDAPSARNLGFQALCGENRGQHIYIPVNATTGATAVRLNFHLYNRSVPVGGTYLSAPRWLLRITQLECAPAEYDYSSVHAALASAGHQAVNKHVLAATDADLLAPQGCLQYFPQRSGTYMSFNYPAQAPRRRYLANLHYAICFRRRAADCGIRHTVVGDFLIDYNERAPQTYVDRACDTGDPNRRDYTGDDYLYVPNGIVNARLFNILGTHFATKFCGLSVQAGDTITSYAPGPMYVYFHSDDITFFTHISDEGFQLSYEVFSTNCRVNDPGTSGAAG